MRRDIVGTIYLLHFEVPYHHAQHYLGWSEHPEERWADHRAHLMVAIRRAGISFTVVRTWQGDRHLERRLHKRHDNRSMCPICRAERRRQARWLYQQHQHQKKSARDLSNSAPPSLTSSTT